MPIRLTAAPSDNGGIKLVPPIGRHLESAGWWVAAQVLKGKLLLRVWLEATDGFRVIVIDGRGAELGSLTADRYKDATTALGLRGPTEHTGIEGRRLVPGGDRDWEIAAEIHTVGDEQLLYLRIWIQKRQRFVLYVIDREGAVLDRATGDYTQAKQRALSHLLA